MRADAMSFLCALSLTLAAMLPAPAANAQASVHIRLAHVLADTHSWNVAARGFAADVANETDGRVDIRVFPFGQLGSEKDLVEGMQLGTIQAGIIGSGSFQSAEPKMGIVEMPYAWPSRETAFAALDGDFGKELERLLYGKDLVVLAWWENGYRHITSATAPVRTPADLAGVRIRVTPDKVRLDTFRALGAQPAPLAFGELYSALQQGVFDAQENPISIIYSSSFYEVQKYLSLTGHIWGAACLTVSKSVWDRLSPEDQAVMRLAAEKWRDIQRQMIADADARLLYDLRAKGMVVETVDQGPFKTAVAAIWASQEPVYGPELLALFERYRH